jgi:hypothetical protein
MTKMTRVKRTCPPIQRAWNLTNARWYGSRVNIPSTNVRLVGGNNKFKLFVSIEICYSDSVTINTYNALAKRLSASYVLQANPSRTLVGFGHPVLIVESWSKTQAFVPSEVPGPLPTTISMSPSRSKSATATARHSSLPSCIGQDGLNLIAVSTCRLSDYVRCTV